MISLPLFSLLTDVNVLAQHGPTDVPITGLTLDSREAGPGVAFCALRGTATDGHKFIEGPWKRASLPSSAKSCRPC